MTIINANYYLEQLLAPAALERIARLCTAAGHGGDQVNITRQAFSMQATEECFRSVG